MGPQKHDERREQPSDEEDEKKSWSAGAGADHERDGCNRTNGGDDQADSTQQSHERIVGTLRSCTRHSGHRDSTGLGIASMPRVSSTRNVYPGNLDRPAAYTMSTDAGA